MGFATVKNGFRKRWRALKQSAKGTLPLLYLIFGGFVVFCLAYFFFWLTPGVEKRNSDFFRWYGMFLQFAGLSAVVVGLAKSSAFFGVPFVSSDIVAWFKNLRRIVNPLPTIHVSGNLLSANATMSAQGIAHRITGKGSTEDRLAALEAETMLILQNVATQIGEVKALERKISDGLRAEREQRESADRKISENLQTATIGDIKIELAGVCYFLIGILFATIPVELALLFGTN